MSKHLKDIIQDPEIINWDHNTIKTHPLHANSYFFLPAAELRYREDILLELFREMFFEDDVLIGNDGEVNRSKKRVPIKPEQSFYSEKEKAIIHAFEGKKLRNSKEIRYIPAYPHLAKGGKFRDRAARVINGYYFSIINWHLEIEKHGNHFELTRAKEDFFVRLKKALWGSKSNLDEKKVEIMSLFIDFKNIKGHLSDEEFKTRISKFHSKEKYNDIEKPDFFAERVYRDSLVIIELEKQIDRIEWINILITYLRFVIPLWMLSQTRILNIIRNEIFNSLTNNLVLPNQDQIIQKIRQRHVGILVPSSTPTNMGKGMIEEYMKNRVELDILLHVLENVCPNCKAKFIRLGNKYKSLTIKDYNDQEVLSINNFIRLIKENENTICDALQIENISLLPEYIQKQAYNIESWVKQTTGTGQTLNELLDLARTSSGEDLDEGGLLKAVRKNRKIIGYKIIPGPQVIKVMVLLLFEMQKKNNNHPLLTLDQLVTLFESYGIEFSYNDDSRKVLLDALLELGILKGSPDAGGAAQLVNYYSFNKEKD